MSRESHRVYIKGPERLDVSGAGMVGKGGIWELTGNDVIRIVIDGAVSAIDIYKTNIYRAWHRRGEAEVGFIYRWRYIYAIEAWCGEFRPMKTSHVKQDSAHEKLGGEWMLDICHAIALDFPLRFPHIWVVYSLCVGIF